MNKPELLSRDLPDPESAERFLRQLSEQHASQYNKLLKKDGLLSDILTLVAYSPLIAATLLQNPEYFWWLDRKRSEQGSRSKSELLESLARFSLTNSQIDHNVLLARFRRRELMRIFLADIRRLLTIAEITEAISNLADAILENALRSAAQNLENRYGKPQEFDAKGRQMAATFCIVSLGKLGSRELNYSSDIDLLFLYSDEGVTSSTGSREPVTNREYFSKLAEAVSRTVGAQTGEGAAYRVDLRLRPHGRVGPLAMSVKDTVRYYANEAESWERQVLIRSRVSAGDPELFQRFFDQVESRVFASDTSVEAALRNVSLSKQKIDLKNRSATGFDVKLGRGGIREIEFIAQALQLAHGGRDEWLRSPHTLISLSRIADRGLITETELSELFEAYDFLRRLEHILQMENGLQTHTVPAEPERRHLIARRMKQNSPADFEARLTRNSRNVRRIFDKIFADANAALDNEKPTAADESVISDEPATISAASGLAPEIVRSIQKSDTRVHLTGAKRELLAKAASASHRVVELIAAAPHLINDIPDSPDITRGRDHLELLVSAVASKNTFGARMGALRRAWARLHLEIMVLDAAGQIGLDEAKSLQTDLAEASIHAAIEAVKWELSERYGGDFQSLPLAILGLGKLGSGGIDYGSDLDLVMVHDPDNANFQPPGELSHHEFFAKAVELFVTALSGVTRDGSLYRIDLRLRPHGKNGSSVISAAAFVDYVRDSAAIWELLAFLKLRAAGGDQDIGVRVETAVREAIHAKANNIPRDELSAETGRIRARLETERAGVRNSKDVDIKFGSGGMLDVYFAVRYIQLRDNIADDRVVRSTGSTLELLRTAGAFSPETHDALSSGYRFLSALDHNIRLTIGRSSRLPQGNRKAMSVITARMAAASPAALVQQLTIHRLEIRSAFERILKD
ncbi:MAG TPA: DUF294 nucleotidyltransferase-like domain-containing protein [Pyrinomonadaceae bacterium]|nr:DUF294 nucleotidyltransferase-like domain-containing protein [Pyrinomonadaceae bacterium]